MVPLRVPFNLATAERTRHFRKVEVLSRLSMLRLILQTVLHRRAILRKSRSSCNRLSLFL